MMKTGEYELLSGVQAANSAQAPDTMAEIGQWAEAAVALLERRHSGLRAGDVQALLANLEAFGQLFGFLEQLQRLFIADGQPEIAAHFVERSLAIILDDKNGAAALHDFAASHRVVAEFAAGYSAGMRVAVQMAQR